MFNEFSNLIYKFRKLQLALRIREYSIFKI